jgi:hypothetical protein
MVIQVVMNHHQQQHQYQLINNNQILIMILKFQLNFVYQMVKNIDYIVNQMKKFEILKDV